MLVELTLNLLVGDVAGLQLLCDFAGHGQIELSPKLERDFLRIAEGINDGRRLAMPGNQD